MDEAHVTEECDCGLPDRWARDPNFPVEFDEQINEYHLKFDDMVIVMQFCFWCGGRLANSKRGEFFTTPSEEEKAEVRRILSDAKSAQDVLRLLGSPDETHEWNESAARSCENVVRWKRNFRYSGRWNSLTLDVQEMPDGRFAFAIAGQYVGPRSIDEVADPPSRWWQFWKMRST